MIILQVVLGIFVLQIVCYVIIFFILRSVLNKMLIETAIQTFDRINAEYIKQDQRELKIITATGRLEEIWQRRLKFSSSRKRGKPVELVIEHDKNIMGGMIICLTDKPMDFSVRTRLKQSGLIGKIFGVK